MSLAGRARRMTPDLALIRKRLDARPPRSLEETTFWLGAVGAVAPLAFVLLHSGLDFEKTLCVTLVIASIYLANVATIRVAYLIYLFVYEVLILIGAIYIVSDPSITPIYYASLSRPSIIWLFIFPFVTALTIGLLSKYVNHLPPHAQINFPDIHVVILAGLWLFLLPITYSALTSAGSAAGLLIMTVFPFVALALLFSLNTPTAMAFVGLLSILAVANNGGFRYPVALLLAWAGILYLIRYGDRRVAVWKVPAGWAGYAVFAVGVLALLTTTKYGYFQNVDFRQLVGTEQVAESGAGASGPGTGEATEPDSFSSPFSESFESYRESAEREPGGADAAAEAERELSRTETHLRNRLLLVQAHSSLRIKELYDTGELYVPPTYWLSLLPFVDKPINSGHMVYRLSREGVGDGHVPYLPPAAPAELYMTGGFPALVIGGVVIGIVFVALGELGRLLRHDVAGAAAVAGLVTMWCGIGGGTALYGRINSVKYAAAIFLIYFLAVYGTRRLAVIVRRWTA